MQSLSINLESNKTWDLQEDQSVFKITFQSNWFDHRNSKRRGYNFTNSETGDFKIKTFFLKTSLDQLVNYRLSFSFMQNQQPTDFISDQLYGCKLGFGL